MRLYRRRVASLQGLWRRGNIRSLLLSLVINLQAVYPRSRSLGGGKYSNGVFYRPRGLMWGLYVGTWSPCCVFRWKLCRITWIELRLHGFYVVCSTAPSNKPVVKYEQNWTLLCSFQVRPVNARPAGYPRWVHLFNLYEVITKSNRSLKRRLLCVWNALYFHAWSPPNPFFIRQGWTVWLILGLFKQHVCL